MPGDRNDGGMRIYYNLNDYQRDEKDFVLHGGGDYKKTAHRQKCQPYS